MCYETLENPQITQLEVFREDTECTSALRSFGILVGSKQSGAREEESVLLQMFSQS